MNYASKGEAYTKEKPITEELITGENNGIIKPRILKDEALRKTRTDEKAEVFTPAWICNAQNNLVDNAWFGVKDVFNTENKDKTWTSVPKGEIQIPENRSWKEYVKLLRLEMSCGEAPYLVSRYDVTTGQIIPIPDRIGLLDRKLKLINQFTRNEPTKLNKREWRRWALKALQSVYGFDWQGDNVLLAREALLLTYIDFYVDKWGKLPLKEALENPVEVISWNIWQMDGLQGTLPGAKGIPLLQRVTNGYDLFKDETLCIIKEWHKQEPPEGKNIRFVDLINSK
ncbi:type II restriction endonuclease [gut metagenome]|uniref:Type II restriction endonuclease n=1 Tax=gut metagenome TaxID=749906 RepID=J9CBV0_9ZZZZ